MEFVEKKVTYEDKTLTILVNYYQDVLQNIDDLKHEILDKNTELNWVLKDDDDIGKRNMRYRIKELYQRFLNEKETIKIVGSIFMKVNQELNQFKNIEVDLSGFNEEPDWGYNIDLEEEGLEWLEKVS